MSEIPLQAVTGRPCSVISLVFVHVEIMLILVEIASLLVAIDEWSLIDVLMSRSADF